jgi:hypothetical protein
MLSEVNQAQKHKGHIFSLIRGRSIQRQTDIQKQSGSYINSDVEHVYKSGSYSMELRERGKEKEKEHQ